MQEVKAQEGRGKTHILQQWFTGRLRPEILMGLDWTK